MKNIERKVKTTFDNLFSFANKKLCILDNVEYVKADGYKTNNTPPNTGWMPFEEGMLIHGSDDHYWFRANFKTPAAKPHTSYYLKCITGFEGKWDAVNPQGLIYLNGDMVQGCDTNHTEVYLDPDTEYTMHNYFYIGLIDKWVPLTFSLYELDEKTEHLYYDLKVAYDTCNLYEKDSDEYNAVLTLLEQTVNILDLRNFGDSDYYASVDKAIEFINEKLYNSLCSDDGKPIVSCIGHTHIDVEWQWARAQTREKIQRSFATANALMKKYPEYKFTLSQPELYRYLKEEAPEKYEELKQLVKEGRWEPEGAMWVESDCNLISGESFVRQIMQGKRFFMDEFGVDCKILFLPDVFGYSAALPQILNKCGIRHFVTSKISWNDTNCMPVDTFIWEGIDGSEIFTNFITTQKHDSTDTKTTYVGTLNPSQIKGSWNRYLQKNYSKRVMTTYGYGDGGGGPTKVMLETQRRLSKGFPSMPVTIPSTLLSHLDDVRKQFDENCKTLDRTPKWVGELYLEFHRGTYTSIAKNKRNNRKAEFMLQKSELLSYTDFLHGGDYDVEGLYNNWNMVLHNQFHDIIPGSSIHEVYEGTDRDYAMITDYCEGVISNKLKTISENVSATDGLLVYNPLGFDRKGTFEIDGKTVETDTLIPAFGWTVIDSYVADANVTVNGLCAENKYFKLTLDDSGKIQSLFDKRASREVFDGVGNELQAFEDFPYNYDAWEISDYYKQKKYEIDDKAEITAVFDGCRAGFKVVHKYMDSTIVQHIWLYSDIERIDFDNEIDWHQKHQLLKVAFPINVHTMSATYEIQYGHVTRPTHENTSWDKAKFEVYGHKWVDLSENGYGVSLLNDCKYGFNTEGNVLKLTMLKCASFPDPHADEGLHVFTYSLMPHIGDFRDGDVIKESYSLNQPLAVLPVSKEKGTLPDCYSLVSCDKNNIVIETVKKAEADDGMIVRMYDSFDCKGEALVSVTNGFKRVYLCDLLENEISELEFIDNTVKIRHSNFEIITLKFVK